MKKILTASLVAASALTLAACGGSTTENVTVTNEIVLNEGDVLVDNLAVDDSLTAIDNATDNLADATGNALSNVQ